MPPSLTDTVGKICYLVKVKIFTSHQLNLTFNHCINIFYNIFTMQTKGTAITIFLVYKTYDCVEIRAYFIVLG